jgi:hypothetical protein
MKNQSLSDSPEQKIRKCLICRSPFPSAWAGERICRRCKDTAAWRSGLSNDRAKRALINRIVDLAAASWIKGDPPSGIDTHTPLRRTINYSQINHRNRLGSSHAEWHEERYKNS